MNEPNARRIEIIAILVAWATTAAGFIWFVAGDRASALAEVKATKTVIADHETRIRAIESVAVEIKNDVGWLRWRFDPSAPKPPPNPTP